ncbi:hypothetical protein BpHYR1_051654 [Brachionus plicatilis]|uniref:Uncharacterized protein n=1 Tax=Brachionus plicatilis TaxID=10195 RepID=A0A3M7PZ60_BRAPC|nr:hypothetical protein BpHYR1_051654 [Brachionus plicatilis]
MVHFILFKTPKGDIKKYLIGDQKSAKSKKIKLAFKISNQKNSTNVLLNIASPNSLTKITDFLQIDLVKTFFISSKIYGLPKKRN